VKKYELFHEVSGVLSAAARRVLVARGLEERVRIRNIFYPEVQADFAARGGTVLPAVWDGERLVEGEAAVALLEQL
jgi:hypothetical protein